MPATAAAVKPAVKAPKPLPAPNSDFYDLYETLSAEELATLKPGVVLFSTMKPLT